MLVNVGDAVFPNLSLPVGRGKFVLQHPLVTVQRRCLAGLFFQSHPREQVFDAAIDWRLRVFVDIHPAVLVQIDPGIVIDGLFRDARYLSEKARPR